MKPCRLALGAAALALILSDAALADTLIDDVNGMSIGRDGDIERFTGMVIDDDGRVARLLSRRDDRPDDVDFQVDGRGRTVMPGFVDAHARVMELGLARLSLDLAPTDSLEEALSRVAAYAQAHSDRPWLVGRGWDQLRWNLGRFPTAEELDAVTGDRPIWLVRVDGRAGWANSAALRIADITADTPDPAGGRIERVDGSREPSGVLVGAAMELLEAKVTPPRPEDLDLALHEAQEFLLRNGVTAATDMGTSLQDWMAYRRAGDEGRLRIRIMAYAGSVPEMLLIGGPRPTPWLYRDRLRLNGLALTVDGALGWRGALLKQPYTDAADNRGIAILNGTQLRNLISRAAMDGYQVAIQATGDAANAEALSAIEDLADDYDGDRRWRIEYADLVDPADISRFGEHGIIASMPPLHQTTGRVTAEARLGPDRIDGAYAWRSLRDAGAGLAFGTDTPAQSPDPLAGIAAAISREDAQGQPFGGWRAEESIPLEQALAAYTAGAAYAGFADGRFGTLAEGERADFIMLDGDPAMASPAGLRRLRVLETWVGGERLYVANDETESAAPAR